MAGFTIQKPNHKRKSYGIYVKTYCVGVKPKYKRIEDPRLETINENLSTGVLSFDESVTMIAELVKKLRLELKLEAPRAIIESEINRANLQAFNKFWQQHYSGKKILSRTYCRFVFLRALKGINSLSLYTATRDELQTAVDQAFDEKQHKRYVGRINALLGFVGRDFKLYTKRLPMPVVNYLTRDEFNRLLQHIDSEELRALYSVLFNTGMRVGEAFMVTPRSLRPNGSIYINQQLTKECVVREIKNRKAHTTLLLGEGLAEFNKWASVVDKVSWRNRYYLPLIDAAIKAFPGDRSKQVKPHDLRHSFVIELLSKGVSIDRCARLIGDTLAATEKHYGGFIMADAELAAVQAIISGAQPTILTKQSA